MTVEVKKLPVQIIRIRLGILTSNPEARELLELLTTKEGQSIIPSIATQYDSEIQREDCFLRAVKFGSKSDQMVKEEVGEFHRA